MTAPDKLSVAALLDPTGPEAAAIAAERARLEREAEAERQRRAAAAEAARIAALPHIAPGALIEAAKLGKEAAVREMLLPSRRGLNVNEKDSVSGGVRSCQQRVCCTNTRATQLPPLIPYATWRHLADAMPTDIGALAAAPPRPPTCGCFPT